MSTSPAARVSGKNAADLPASPRALINWSGSAAPGYCRELRRRAATVVGKGAGLRERCNACKGKIPFPEGRGVSLGPSSNHSPSMPCTTWPLAAQEPQRKHAQEEARDPPFSSLMVTRGKQGKPIIGHRWMVHFVLRNYPFDKLHTRSALLHISGPLHVTHFSTNFTR